MDSSNRAGSAANGDRDVRLEARPPSNSSTMLPAKRRTRVWQWFLAIVGALVGFEIGYQRGIMVAVPLALTAGMIGRTIDTRRFRHWLYYPAFFVVSLATVRLTPKRTDETNALKAFNQGVDASRNANWDLAITRYDEALRLRPGDTQAYVNRGCAKQRKGDVDAAIADFTTAIQIDSKEFRAYLNRGLALLDIGEYERCIADCNAALSIDPQIARAYLVRGMAFREMGKTDLADSDLRNALRLDPSLRDAATDESDFIPGLSQ